MILVLLCFAIALVVVLVVVLVGGMAYVRLAPSDPARWHANPSKAPVWAESSPWGQVIARNDGAVLRLPPDAGLLARLDAIALATPRTSRLAGSLGEGRITWITRSGFWGFPDYTTAEMRGDGLYLNARLRFGKSDLGVNAARLRDWQSKL